MKTVTKLENTFEFEGCLEEGTGNKMGSLSLRLICWVSFMIEDMKSRVFKAASEW